MSSQTRLMELVDRWATARDAGQPIPPEELCQDCPDLLPQLEGQIAMLQAIDARAEGVALLDETAAEANAICAQTRLDELRLLAKGGLGIVYSAEETRLGRHVAVKFLQREHDHDELSRRQFLLEAEVTSRLEHPGVAPVYCAGEVDDGRPFYAMRLIQGQTLLEAIDAFHKKHPMGLYDEQGSELQTLLSRFISVCETVAYAHNRGILHRDIKPANVMLGRYGETLVVDWGLAMAVGREEEFKLTDERTLMPQVTSESSSSDTMAGTPAYMSPEQLSGAESLQPATDIYSLGATLYQLLTDRHPIEASNLVELRQRAIRGDITPPTRHAARLSKPLQAICLKALATNPGDRYRTAMQMATDLRRHLADEPVSVYEGSMSDAAARWTRRNLQVVQTSGVALVLLLVTALGLIAWQSATASRAVSARKEGLKSRASLASGALASELDRRLLVLEGAARDRQLIDAVATAHAEPEDRDRWQAVNQWLTDQRDYWSDEHHLKSYCWFVVLDDGRGTQIARAPPIDDASPRPGDASEKPRETIGRSYARREYFHGQGPVYQQDETEEIEPTRTSVLTAPFQGTNGEPVLAFATPIRAQASPDADGKPLGVLGMAVEVFDITDLGAYLGDGQALTIVHTRLDFFDKQQTRRGLLMQHDYFHHSQGAFSPYWLTEQTLARIDAARHQTLLLPDYLDPLADVCPEQAGLWMAAAAPVVIPARDVAMKESGWCVIVQERP